MKIKYIRSHRGKKIGTIEDLPDRVAHRFVNKGMAKFVRDYKPKGGNARTRNKSKRQLDTTDNRRGTSKS